MFPGMSVTENLEMGAYLHKGSLTNEFDRVFTLFPALGERRKQAAGTLSGGEQQMVAIGRALMSAPKLLLLDEPSMGLAPRLVAQIFSIVTEINEQGTTILLVEQNAAQALRRAPARVHPVDGRSRARRRRGSARQRPRGTRRVPRSRNRRDVGVCSSHE